MSTFQIHSVAGHVEGLMTPAPITFPGGMSASDAISVLKERRVRHAPVVDHVGRYLGMVSLETLASLDADEPIDSAIALTPPTRPDACVGAVARFMLRSKSSALAVLDGDRIVGIVTEADFLRERVRLAGELGCAHDDPSAGSRVSPPQPVVRGSQIAETARPAAARAV